MRGFRVSVLLCAVLGAAVLVPAIAVGGTASEVTALAADDRIPGVSIPDSPFSGTVGGSGDGGDVFSIHLEKGELLTADITSEGEVELDLLGPGSTKASKEELDFAWGGIDTQYLSHVAPESGTYYLYVWDMDEEDAVDYRLSYRVAAAAPDDCIPGIAIPASPLTGTVSLPTDEWDVYAVFLRSGQALQTSTDSTRTYLGVGPRLAVAPPGSTSEWDARELSYQGDWRNRTYMASTTGMHYLFVGVRWEGRCPYKVHYAVADHAAFTPLSASKILAEYGDSYTLSGRLMSGANAVPGARVVLQRAYRSTGNRGTFTDVGATALTDSNGRFTFRIRPYWRRYYRVRFAGVPGSLIPAYSGERVVLPRASVSVPSAPPTMSPAAAFTVRGTLRPWHPVGREGLVRVYRYRYERGEWKRYGYVVAKTGQRTDDGTPYAASVRLPWRGTWRLRAFAPTDYWHGYAWSPGVATVSVR
jgi:hypothetical protein